MLQTQLVVVGEVIRGSGDLYNPNIDHAVLRCYHHSVCVGDKTTCEWDSWALWACRNGFMEL